MAAGAETPFRPTSSVSSIEQSFHLPNILRRSNTYFTKRPLENTRGGNSAQLILCGQCDPEIKTR